MRHGLLACVLIFHVAGCAAVPFGSPADASMKDVSPHELLARFEERLPSRFTLLNSLVFQFGLFNKVSALGYISVDREHRRFHVVCMSPVGVKLFEVSGDEKDIDRHFAIGDFGKNPYFFRSVAEDIRRVYFGLVPPEETPVYRGRRRMYFYSESGSGEETVYRFGSPDHVLLDKTRLRDHVGLWRVSYYEYRSTSEGYLPAGTVLENWEYGYRITIRLKDIRSE